MDIPVHIRDQAAAVRAHCKPVRHRTRWLWWITVCRNCGQSWPCTERVWADNIAVGIWPGREHLNPRSAP